MKVGEVWILRCFGTMLYATILKVYDVGFDFLNLETGEVDHWYANPQFGDKVGQWRPL